MAETALFDLSGLQDALEKALGVPVGVTQKVRLLSLLRARQALCMVL